ncbi:hypothetical protein [Niallia sp. RD1]|uniref:hypothetical protein n=1 Tax=Niallia sp. RD1 TaxID=2962858 RepID=UPI0020C1A7F0|nr:hypothetical protein [Niallia sp. RD1]UTI44739.1 hypothetical protein NKG37_25360 [Niallia sp. RD1]
MNTETFQALCYKCKLTRADLEDMTIGDCLDYIDSYVELMNPKKKKKNKARKAKQNDFDKF